MLFRRYWGGDTGTDARWVGGHQSQSSGFVTYDTMTTFAKIPAYQCEIPDNNFEEYSPNKCFTN